MTEKSKPQESDCKTGLKPLEVILGLAIVIIWLIIFISGILINSEPYRNVITGQVQDLSLIGNEPSLFKAWFVVIFSYTPSNLLMLCVFAGMIGAVSRIAKLHVTKNGEVEIPSDKTSPIMSGVFRGMFIYLLMLSGVLVLDEAALTAPTQDQYARLAGIVSLFCFLISYDPSRFRTLLDRGFKKMQNDDNNGKNNETGD